MKALLTAIVACAVLAFAGCGDDDDSADSGGGTTTAAQSDSPSPEGSGSNTDTSTKPTVTVPEGVSPEQLAFQDPVKGKGPGAKNGDEVTVQYVGVGYDSGKEFDASWDRGEPFTFQLGAGEVIPGWDQGLVGMKAGGRRELVIPAELAYGQAGRPPSIGPNEPLVFVVDLLAIK